jgi:hypothetical protein
MAAGYSGTPLAKKLGIKAKMTALILAPPADYLKEMSAALQDVEQVKALKGKIDFIHLFSKSKSELAAKFPRLKEHLKPDGLLWISWPKGGSKIETDLSENIVRTIGLASGLVDVKVCAVDEVWSGLKFVHRKTDRR